MSDMIEKCARAIAYEMGDTMGDSRAVFWNGYSYKESARKAARAVIEAMREPTIDQQHAAMGIARKSEPVLLPPCKELWAAGIIWQAMIDNALA